MTDDLLVERRIAARPAAVFAYLTDSDRWARWQGQSAVIEPTPGGRFVMNLANGPSAAGEFVAVEPDRRIVFTWGWVGHPGLPPGSSTVEIELVPDGDGTIVRLTHRDLPAEERSIHRAGWDHYLPRLAVAATGGDPGPDVPPSDGEPPA
jgi:uncharacterized protein YndB with AHSA1/START domain